MIDEIKQTDIWSKLMSNPKFEIEFERFINNSSYQLDINDLVFSIENNKLTVSYSTDIKERDLDCQYRLFVQKEFYVDDEVNLIVNELSGVLESNYGYDFDNTIGGIINTHYSAIQYDIDGIELNYQSYSDKYHLDNRQFKTFRNDIRDVILNAYNPNLLSSISLPRPNIIGKEGRFIKQTRSRENLGIVEVIRHMLTPNLNVSDYKDELYFNTFLSSQSVTSPELIHIINGFPFAKLEDNEKIKINKDYAVLGLNDHNYQEVARDRFLKELIEEKQHAKNKEMTLKKFDLMIDRLKSEIKERTR